MRTMNKILAAAGLIAALTLPATAGATGGYGKKHHGIYYGGPTIVFGYGGYGYYGKGKHYKHGKHHKHGKRYKHDKPHYGYVYGGKKHGHYYAPKPRKVYRAQRHGHYYAPKPRYKKSHSHGGYGCHPVTKVDYYHGRKAKLGGTMCYDNWGQAYVVPGSRYVIHYY